MTLIKYRTRLQYWTLDIWFHPWNTYRHFVFRGSAYPATTKETDKNNICCVQNVDLANLIPKLTNIYFYISKQYMIFVRSMKTYFLIYMNIIHTAYLYILYFKHINMREYLHLMHSSWSRFTIESVDMTFIKIFAFGNLIGMENKSVGKLLF